MICKKLLISGQVQNVGFRAWTFRQSRKFPEISGTVKNLSDGRVEVILQGPPETVNSMIYLCQRGPASSKVEQVGIMDHPINPQQTFFEIKND